MSPDPFRKLAEEDEFATVPAFEAATSRPDEIPGKPTLELEDPFEIEDQGPLASGDEFDVREQEDEFSTEPIFKTRPQETPEEAKTQSWMPFVPQQSQAPTQTLSPQPQTAQQKSQDSSFDSINKRIDSYSKAAAKGISDLYGISEEDAQATLFKIRDATKKKYDEELGEVIKDQQEYENEYWKRMQENVGDLISKGTQMQMAGGPNAFLEGRENVEARKAARSKAIEDFDVNFISRAAASGILQTAGGFVDFGATISELVGSDRASKYLTEKGRGLAELRGYIPFKVQGVEDVQNAWDVGALAGKATLEMAPQMAASYLAGGGLARVGQAVKGGTLTKKAEKAYRTAGAFLANTALETGGIARNQLEENNRLDPKMAIAGGVAAGSLETVADVALFKKLWPFLRVEERELLIKDFAGKTAFEAVKQIGNYTGKTLARQIPVESVTEAGQEAISIAAVELSKKDPEFFKSPEMDEKKFDRYVKRVVDAGVYGGLGTIGLTGGLAGTQGSVIAIQANKTLDMMRQAKDEARAAKEEELANLRKAAEAEASGAPLTSREAYRRTSTGALVRDMAEDNEVKKGLEPMQEIQGPATQAETQPEAQATTPREGGSLAEFQFTDQVFKTQEEAEKFILSQKNPGDFEMMDNSDVNDEGNQIEEYIILKKDGAEMSIPQSKEEPINEEEQTEEADEIPSGETLGEYAGPAGQENLQPQLPELPQQDQPVSAPVQPETAQPGQEAVAPALTSQPTQQELAKQVGYPDPKKPLLPTVKDPVVSSFKPKEKPEVEKSPGHVAFFDYENTTYELYKDAKGDLFRAPISNVFDVDTGYRIGRWEAPAQMADRQAARILKQETGPEDAKAGEKPATSEVGLGEQPKFDEEDSSALASTKPEFVKYVRNILTDNTPESRKAAFNLLSERFQKAVEKEDQSEQKDLIEILDGLTDRMAQNDGDTSSKEAWNTARSVQGFMSGVYQAVGPLGKPSFAVNNYVEQYKGVPQFREKQYDAMMSRARSKALDIQQGIQGKQKLPVQQGKEKSPPIVSEPYENWVEYGKNWASAMARYAALDVGRDNQRASRQLSYDNMTDKKLGEGEQFTDDGEEVVADGKEIGVDEVQALSEEAAYQSKVLNETQQKLENLKNQFSNNPLQKAVFDSVLGKFGLPNESGYDTSTDDFDIAQELKGQVADNKGNPIQTNTLIKRISETRNKEIYPAIQKVLDFTRQQIREVSRPEAVKKEKRLVRRTARENRAAKNEIFEKMRGLQKDGLVSYGQMQEAMDAVPEAPSEETLAALNEELDAMAMQEDFDQERFNDIIRERIAENEATENQTADGQSPVEILSDAPGLNQAGQAAQQDQPAVDGGSSVGPAVSGNQSSKRKEGAEQGSQENAESVSESLRAAAQALEKRTEAVIKRTNLAQQIGYINEDERRGILDTFIAAYGDGPAALEDAVSAAEAALDIAEATAAGEKSGNVGSNGSVRSGVDRGPGSPGLDNAGIPEQVAGETTPANRQASQRPSGGTKTVSGADQKPGGTQQSARTDEARPAVGQAQIDYGPRPGLQTSFASEIPASKTQYVKAGDFQLDERQAQAVNLMVSAWETTKSLDPKDRKRGFLLGDGTGIGKTLTYLVAGQKIYELSGKKVLLLALNDTWREQRYISDVVKFGINPDAFTVATYPQLRRGMVEALEENKRGFSTVIFDEAHALKNQDSLTARSAEKIKSDFKIFATATPLDEDFQAAYFISELTGESEDSVLTSLGFRVKYEQDDFGNLNRRVQRVANPRDTKRALAELALSATRNGQYVRRYYPFWGTIRAVNLKLNEQQKSAYRKEMEIWDRKISMAENKMNAKGQRTQAMKRWTEVQKNQYVLDTTLDFLKKNPTGKVVVFSTTANKQKSQAASTRQKDADLLGVAGFMAQELDKRGIKYVKLFGGNKNQKNTFGPLKEFQSRDSAVRVAVATLSSGGTGIDLDDTFGDQPRLVLLAGTDFSAAVVEQAMGRTSRRNTKSPSDLRLIQVPESYGDQRAAQIQEGKMENLRSIQGQDVEDVEVETGGELVGDISTVVPVTEGDETVELIKAEGIEVDGRISSLDEATQGTIKEAAKLLAKNSPSAKIVFGKYEDNAAWADWTKGRTDVVYLNPEIIHKIIGEALQDPKSAQVAKDALELILDEELSHNALFQSLFEEAESLGVDKYQHVLSEMGKISKGLTEDIRSLVTKVYEGVGGKIKSNEHLAMEYIRMVHQWARKGTSTESYFEPRAGTPTVFARLLPRSRVSAEGQTALAKLFHQILGFFKNLLRPGLSDSMAKQIQKRIEALDKIFQETKTPKLGSFGNTPMFDEGKTPSGFRMPELGYVKSGNRAYRMDGSPAAIRLTSLKGSDGKLIPASGIDDKTYERARPLPQKLKSTELIENNPDLKSAYDNIRTDQVPMAEDVKYFWARFRAGFENYMANHFQPTKVLEEEALTRLREKDGEGKFPLDASGHNLFPGNESAYKLFVLAQDAGAIVEEVLTRGIPEWHNKGDIKIKEGTRGLVEIFAPLNTHKDAREFRLYLYGRRAKELESLGKKSGLSEKQIEEINKLGSVKAGKFKDGPTYSEIFNQYREFQDAILQFAVESGLVKPELKALLNELHKDYVPYNRISDARSDDFDAKKVGVLGPYSRKQMAGQRSGIKRYKGSNQYVNDLYDNIERNIAHLIMASVRNVAMQRLEGVNTILNEEAGLNFWEPVSPMHQVLIPDGEIIKALKSEGYEELAKELELGGNLNKMFGFGMGPKDSRQAGIISYVKNGKVAYRKIEDGNESLLNSLTIQQDSTSIEAKKAWVRLLVGSRQLFQKGVTTSLEFTGANLARDSISAWMMNPGSFAPIINTLKGFVSAIKTSPWYPGMNEDKSLLQELRLQGAGNPTNYSDLRGKGVLGRANRNLRADRNIGVMELTIEKMNDAMRFLDTIGQFSETSARLSVVKAAIEKNPNLSSMEKAFLYRQSTTDFSLHGAGSLIRWLNMTVPFFQAGINGLYRTYLAAKAPRTAPGAKEDPNKKKKIFKANDFFYKASLVTAFAVAYTIHKLLDPRYQDLPEDETDRYFVFFVGGVKMRIPKPHEIGTIFFTIPERIVEAMVTRDIKKFGEGLKRDLSGIFRFNAVPQVAQPIVNLWADRNMFLGTPIKGQGLKDLPPSLQYRENTPSVLTDVWAQIPGIKDTQVIGSPVQMQALIEGYLGTLGNYMLVAASQITDIARAKDFGEAPERLFYETAIGIRRFVQNAPGKNESPTYRTRYAKDFYEVYDGIKTADRTYSRIKKMTSEEQREQYASDYAIARAWSSEWRRAAEAVNELNDAMQEIRKDKTLSGKEKQKTIESLQRQKNEVMKQYTKSWEEFSKKAEQSPE